MAQDALRREVRPLYVALGEVIANAKPGRDQELLERCNRIFSHLTPLQQIACRLEIDLIRKAKRGELLSEIVEFSNQS